MRSKTIFDPVFRARIIVTLGPIQEMNKFYERNKYEEQELSDHWGAYSETLIEDNKEQTYHIHFDLYGFTTIVHETNHITFEILRDRGMSLEDSTKEVFAYYQDWLAGKCRDILEIWTKKKKRK